MFTSKIYQKSPIFAQNFILSVRALLRKLLREGRAYMNFYAKIKGNENDQLRLDGYVNERLSVVFDNALQAVPFYKHRVNANSKGIERFPFISKLDVKQFGNDFIYPDFKGVTVDGATSGTTGTPLQIKQSMDSVIREQGFVSRHLDWAGYRAGDKRAWIRGDMIVPLSQKTGPFWRYSWFENMILLSSFHMAPTNLQSYIDAMVSYGVNIIQAYPSSIVTLAKHLEINNEFYPSKLKSIVTSSESLNSEDRKLVEERFRCKVFDWYGLFERVAAIGNCEHGRYHIISDYAHVELLPAGDERYEIVGTNFNNLLQPLIRYRTGDHVYLSTETACPCGRVFPIIERIEGRVGDFLIGEDGQRVHILNHIPKGVKGLLATQFVQDELKAIEVKAVVDSRFFDKQQEQVLIANTKARLGQSMEVFVTIVDKIPKTKNGKTRQAICAIKD